jgi:hypothetical protein
MAHSNIDRNVLNRTSYEVSKIFDYQIAALLETQKITGMVSQEVVEAVEDRKQISKLLDTLNDTTTEIATVSKGGAVWRWLLQVCNRRSRCCRFSCHIFYAQAWTSTLRPRSPNLPRIIQGGHPEQSAEEIPGVLA